MQQVVDLEGSQQFQALPITLVSISIDPTPQLAEAVAEFGVTSPHLYDKDGVVTAAYGADQWAMPSGEPGHTFVLVGRDGMVRWIRDYAAPANGGLMYVPPADLLPELQSALDE